MGKIIKSSISGKFKNFNGFLERAKGLFNLSALDKYGKRGVEILKETTPKKGGDTANSWYYEIEKRGRNTATISFHNDNIENGYNVAIILQNGHATRSGSWYPGIDYVGPAMEQLSVEITNSL